MHVSTQLVYNLVTLPIVAEYRDPSASVGDRRKRILQIMTMSKIKNQIRYDSILKLHVFHGTGKDDVEQHRFMCEAIWEVKQTTYENAKIV